ncbi:hypothetical protein COPEUT_02833 [Coprococcus eutactus ATCC 27759]|nr:hypothetical protein COPEUT_02833 [Coprococcus eutactus ATCC 27759]
MRGIRCFDKGDSILFFCCIVKTINLMCRKGLFCEKSNKNEIN